MPSHVRQLHKVPTVPISTQPELQATTGYARDAFLTTRKNAPLTHLIYTDSKEVRRICSDTKHTGIALQALKLAFTSLRSSGQTCTLQKSDAPPTSRWLLPHYLSAPYPSATSLVGKPFWFAKSRRDPTDSASSATVPWERQRESVIWAWYLPKLPLQDRPLCRGLLMFLGDPMAPPLEDRLLATTRRTRPPPPSTSMTAAA
ncbi:hypothetical protein HPB47_014571 [Ixodes persulcatus]|uniref:Uncharacterized protein n=1 Tax=Ixodes persulcatus TaxID=34615 RepID=A0AC60QXH9_IXOPE|nr:hypothetical protein HPB47_014571 [Ixodes persulcatus]